MSNITIKVCSKCGAHLVRRANVMATSYPAQYIYDCPECGNVEYDIKCYNGNLTTDDSMDYKKKYEEAMTREEAIKEAYGIPVNKKQHEALQILIPELAESEDEMIRKAIIELLKEVGLDDTGISENVKCMIAYLEKQKDAIPYEKYVMDIAAMSAEMRTKYSAGWNDGYEAKKKEQKPEWSEADEDMLNSCISSIEEVKENRYAYQETDGDTSYDHEIHWLKSLRPQPKWKPSEEQLNSLNYGIYVLEEEGYDASASEIKELYEQLKKLMED